MRVTYSLSPIDQRFKGSLHQEIPQKSLVYEALKRRILPQKIYPIVVASMEGTNIEPQTG